MNGSYNPPPSLDKYTKAYITTLVKPTSLQNTLQEIISTEAFRSGWKKMRETILAGISKIHFSHMKACAQSESLSNFKAIICYIPYSTGYSPTDWKIVVNTMIQKKGKGNKVEELHTINLTEVDFNFNNKIMVRDLLYCAESNNLLLDE